MAFLSLKPALLVAALFAVTALAAQTKESSEPFFSDWLHQAKAGQASTQSASKPSYGYDQVEVKHVCLQETKQRDCRYVGCNDIVPCDGTCIDCVNHVIGTSDFTCCKEEHDYGYEGHDDVFLPQTKVGSCDWDIDIYRDTPIPLESGTAFKLGTAWGTCYLNGDSEYCGSPLCDRLAISVQGHAYVAEAYSHYPPNSGNLADVTCSNIWDPFPRTQPAEDLSKVTKTGKDAKKVHNALAEMAKKSLGQKLEKLINATAASTASAKVQYSSGTEQLYQGVALIVSGPMYVVSLDNDIKYEHGMFEYVPYFIGTAVNGGGNANFPYVRTSAYKLKFVKSHGYGYEGGDSRSQK